MNKCFKSKHSKSNGNYAWKAIMLHATLFFMLLLSANQVIGAQFFGTNGFAASSACDTDRRSLPSNTWPTCIFSYGVNGRNQYQIRQTMTNTYSGTYPAWGESFVYIDTSRISGVDYGSRAEALAACEALVSGVSGVSYTCVEGSDSTSPFIRDQIVGFGNTPSCVHTFRYNIPAPPPPPPPPEPVEIKKTSLIFINGMSNDEKEARENFYALTYQFRVALGSAGITDEFNALHILNKESMSQYYEVARQLLNDAGILPSERGRRLQEMLVGARPWISGVLDTFVQLVMLTDVPNSDPRIQNIVAAIQVEVASGARVILVAHSQGNFFANRAYDLLSSGTKQYVQVLAIATPSDNVSGFGDWTTVSNDIIITRARIFFPGVMIGFGRNTASYINNFEDDNHHSLIKTYLGGDVSSPRIRQQIINSLGRIEYQMN